MATDAPRWEDEELSVKPVTNEDLVCKDCDFRYDCDGNPANVSKCVIFPTIKPVDVLNGGDCNEHS